MTWATPGVALVAFPPVIAAARDMPAEHLTHHCSTTPLWSRHDHAPAPET
ncbi:hypothetical protein HMPREF9057_02135, partial [Actinomyces sp. oral taxon 171 str. F0337]